MSVVDQIKSLELVYKKLAESFESWNSETESRALEIIREIARLKGMLK